MWFYLLNKLVMLEDKNYLYKLNSWSIINIENIHLIKKMNGNQYSINMKVNWVDSENKSIVNIFIINSSEYTTIESYLEDKWLLIKQT